jgi:hypothetical protein
MQQSGTHAKDAVQSPGVAHQIRLRQNGSAVAYTLALRHSSRTERCSMQEAPKKGNPSRHSECRLVRETSLIRKRPHT